MIALTEFAPAKLNLYLHITGRRPDGYHHLDSLVTFADVGDELIFEEAKEFEFRIEGPFAKELEKEDPSTNLVVKAVHSFSEAFSTPLEGRLILKKNLPIASGIGGGSSDAAAVLRAFARYHEIALTDQRLLKVAVQHGQDVPVCLRLLDNYITQDGTLIAPQLPSGYLLIVNPRLPLPTPAVYRSYREGSFPFSKIAQLTSQPKTLPELIAALRLRTNDLEKPAQALVPEIKTALTALRNCKGCLLARMSGSGATCFGIFDSENDSAKAYRQLSLTYPNWWLKNSSFPYGYKL